MRLGALSDVGAREIVARLSVASLRGGSSIDALAGLTCIVPLMFEAEGAALAAAAVWARIPPAATPAHVAGALQGLKELGDQWAEEDERHCTLRYCAVHDSPEWLQAEEALRLQPSGAFYPEDVPQVIELRTSGKSLFSGQPEYACQHCPVSAHTASDIQQHTSAAHRALERQPE